MNSVDRPAKPAHVHGTGRAARVLCAFVAAFASILLVGWSTSGELLTAATEVKVVGVACLLAVVAVVVRARRFGVWIGGGRVLQVSWLSTRSYEIDAVRACVVMDYAGYLNGYNGDGTGRFFKVLAIVTEREPTKDEAWPNDATIASRKRATELAAQINLCIEAERHRDDAR